MRKSYETVVATITELAIGPVVAMLFWLIMGVVVVIATAEGKDAHFTAFLTAISAVGQVSVAFLLYRVTRNQFDLNKQISERQNRIALREPRAKAIEEWQTAMRRASRDPDNEDAQAIYQALWNAEPIFPESCLSEMRKSIDLFDLYLDAYSDLPTTGIGPPDYNDKHRYVSERAREWRKASGKVMQLMREETKALPSEPHELNFD